MDSGVDPGLEDETDVHGQGEVPRRPTVRGVAPRRKAHSGACRGRDPGSPRMGLTSRWTEVDSRSPIPVPDETYCTYPLPWGSGSHWSDETWSKFIH